MSRVEKILDTMARKKTLELCRIGCDKTNYKILKLVKYKKEIKVPILMKECKLTVMPANKRVNDLRRAGLIERIKNKRVIVITPLGNQLIKTVKKMEGMVFDNLVEML